MNTQVQHLVDYVINRACNNGEYSVFPPSSIREEFEKEIHKAAMRGSVAYHADEHGGFHIISGSWARQRIREVIPEALREVL